MKSQLTKVTSILEDTKFKYTQLEKYKNINKGELFQTKEHLEKLYSIIDKLDDKFFGPN